MEIYNYNWTKQVYNSTSTVAKIAKYSLIGIALVAIVETIKNIVLSPFKIIENFYNRNKVEPQNSIVEPSNNNIVEPKNIDILPSTNNQQTTNWKKIGIIAGIGICVLAIAGLAYYFNASNTIALTADQMLTKQGCENLFSKGFEGSGLGCITRHILTKSSASLTNTPIHVPPLNSSNYIVDLQHSFFSSLKHFFCEAHLTKIGRQSLSPIVNKSCVILGSKNLSSTDAYMNLWG